MFLRLYLAFHTLVFIMMPVIVLRDSTLKNAAIGLLVSHATYGGGFAIKAIDACIEGKSDGTNQTRNIEAICVLDATRYIAYITICIAAAPQLVGAYTMARRYLSDDNRRAARALAETHQPGTETTASRC